MTGEGGGASWKHWKKRSVLVMMVEAEVEVLLRGIKCFVQLMELTIDKVLCESLYAVILFVT
jgi:hypothetical protein